MCSSLAALRSCQILNGCSRETLSFGCNTFWVTILPQLELHLHLGVSATADGTGLLHRTYSRASIPLQQDIACCLMRSPDSMLLLPF